MKNINITEVLDKITDIVETYESGAYSDLMVMQRELSCCMYHLSLEQVKAHQEWNRMYYNSKESSNAAKERECDREVPELYLCRKIMETAKSVSIAMGYELKLK